MPLWKLNNAWRDFTARKTLGKSKPQSTFQVSVEYNETTEPLTVQRVVHRSPSEMPKGNRRWVVIARKHFASDIRSLCEDLGSGLVPDHCCDLEGGVLDEAERLQRTRQPALGEEGTGKKSRRRTKKRKRPPTLTEELSSDREMEFRNAEREAEGRIVIEDSDFRGQTSGSIDIPERKTNRRKK